MKNMFVILALCAVAQNAYANLRSSRDPYANYPANWRKDTLYRLIKERSDSKDRFVRRLAAEVCNIDKSMTDHDISGWEPSWFPSTKCDEVLQMIREEYNYDYIYQQERARRSGY